MKRYIPFVLALIVAVNAKAQNDLQRSPGGALYKIFTVTPGEKVKDGDIITFQCVQKTDKDSILYSTYVSGHPAQARIQPSQNVADLMEILPLLSVNDSLVVKVPTDSLFKGRDDQRPPFFPKGSYLDFLIKIQKTQTMDQYMADIKAEETTAANKYITDHKLNLLATTSGLKYVITQPSARPKPLRGDTLLVNYIGRNLDDKVFDSSIESVAKEAGLQQPGRNYEPIQVIVGTGGVIPGWDEGLLLVNEGAKATLVIPSSLAYGAQGAGNDIRPFSTLVFDVEIVKVKRAKHAAAAPAPAKKPVYKKKTATKKN